MVGTLGERTGSNKKEIHKSHFPLYVHVIPTYDCLFLSYISTAGCSNTEISRLPHCPNIVFTRKSAAY